MEKDLVNIKKAGIQNVPPALEGTLTQASHK